MKRCWLGFLFLAPIIILSGCAHRVLPLDNYVAVIEKIEDVPGQHYSVVDGPKPLTRIFLNALRPTEIGMHHRMRILIMGSYLQDRFGAPGDLVSFRMPRKRYVIDDFWMEQLYDYQIVSHRRMKQALD